MTFEALARMEIVQRTPLAKYETPATIRDPDAAHRTLIVDDEQFFIKTVASTSFPHLQGVQGNVHLVFRKIMGGEKVGQNAPVWHLMGVLKKHPLESHYNEPGLLRQMTDMLAKSAEKLDGKYGLKYEAPGAAGKKGREQGPTSPILWIRKNRGDIPRIYPFNPSESAMVQSISQVLEESGAPHHIWYPGKK